MSRPGRSARRNHARADHGPAYRRAVAVAVAVAAVLAGGWLAGAWPGAVVLLYAATGLLSFLAYRHDKRAAQRGRWRTPEKTLHLLDLLGGWPGGLLAQQAFRHKTGKAPFRFVFRLTVVLNCAGFAWLLHDGGFARMQQALLP